MFNFTKYKRFILNIFSDSETKQYIKDDEARIADYRRSLKHNQRIYKKIDLQAFNIEKETKKDTACLHEDNTDDNEDDSISFDNLPDVREGISYDIDGLLSPEKKQFMKEIEEEEESLRVIETARDQKTIDEAVEVGYTPLIKTLKPSNKLKVLEHVCIGGHSGVRTTHKHHCRSWGETLETINKRYVYPYEYDLAYAAYLIPSDIKERERVLLDDLIEDFIGRYNDEMPYRLYKCQAVWDGKDLNIDYENTIIEFKNTPIRIE